MTDADADPVVVVGGGIVGASVAFHLSRREGLPVSLVERAGTLGTGTTGRSSLGLRQYGSEAVQLRMKRYGKRLYNELLAEGPSSLRYEPIEVLHVATTDGGRATIERTHAGEHPTGSPSELVPGSELWDVLVVPDLREAAVAAALYRPNAGFFRSPESLVHAFADRAEANGATIRTGAEVTDVRLRDGRVDGVVVDGDRLGARAVVAAAGPWNNAVAAMAGVDLPLRQQRLSIVELDPGGRLGRTLPKIRHVESGVTFRGRPDGRVLAYHAEPADDPYAVAAVLDPDEDAGVTASARTAILESAEALLPALADADVVHEDVAYTCRTPDGNPIVGWTAVPGFLVGALHSRGIQYAPAVGHVVARQLADGDPTEFYQDVSIGRFDGYAVSQDR